MEISRRLAIKLFACVFACAALLGLVESASAKTLKWGYINTAGKIVIAPAYNDCHAFSEGMARVQDVGWGWIDTTGKRVIPLKFAHSNNFSEGYATVKYLDKWGIIDKKGNFPFPPRFEDMGEAFHHGIVAAKENGKWGFIERDGNFVMPPKYDEVHDFHNGMANVHDAGHWGFINASFEVVFKPQSPKPTDFNEDRAATCTLKGKWGFIDTHGNWIAKPIYRSVGTFSEGLAWVEDEKQKYHFIDKDGKVVTDFAPEVTNVFDMHEGRAGAFTASKGGGYVDRNARFVIKPQFSLLENFDHGIAIVTNEAKAMDFRSGLIDRDGIAIVPVQYKGVHLFSNNLAMVEENELYGFVDKSAKKVIPATFKGALDFTQNLAAVKTFK